MISLAFLFVISLTWFSTVRGETGRYQALVMQEGGRSAQGGSLYPRVFILDTEEGHLWTWEQNIVVTDRTQSRGLGTALIYQGQVRPGKEIGDIVTQATTK